MCSHVFDRWEEHFSFLLTIQGKMTFIKLIITIAYATMLATLVSAPLHDTHLVKSVNQKSIYLVTTTPMIMSNKVEMLEDPSFNSLSLLPMMIIPTIDIGTPNPAVALHHPPRGYLPMKLSPVLSLPIAAVKVKMTVVVSERFPVIFNVTDNHVVIALELPNMTYHHRYSAYPVITDHSDQLVLSKKSKMVHICSIFNKTIHSQVLSSFDIDPEFALCPKYDISLQQLFLRDLNFDRLLFVLMLLMAFLSLLLEWDIDPAKECESKMVLMLLSSMPHCHDILLDDDADTETFQLELPLHDSLFAPPTMTFVHHTRHRVSWNFDFKVQEIPFLSKQEKEERKNHYYETVSWSERDAVSGIGLLLFLFIVVVYESVKELIVLCQLFCSFSQHKCCAVLLGNPYWNEWKDQFVLDIEKEFKVWQTSSFSPPLGNRCSIKTLRRKLTSEKSRNARNNLMVQHQKSKRLEKVHALRRKHSKQLSSSHQTGSTARMHKLVSEKSKTLRRTVLSQHQASKRLMKVRELRYRKIIHEDCHVEYDTAYSMDDLDTGVQSVQGIKEPEMSMEELGRGSRRDEKGRLVWHSYRLQKKKDEKF
jgi:hypothetical protein